MYGVEGITIEIEVIDQIEKNQIYLGKCILGVRPSTANVAVYLELGLKPFLMRVLKTKLDNVRRAKGLAENSLVRKCLEWHMVSDKSSWWKNLKELISKADLQEQFITQC